MSIKVKLGFCSFWEVKLGPIDPIFGYPLLQIIISNFYFWTNSSCLAKFGERGMPMATTMNSRLRKILSLKTAADSIFEPLFDLVPS